MESIREFLEQIVFFLEGIFRAIEQAFGVEDPTPVDSE